jgi:peptide/nickel transport system substrate-binding protein
LVALAVGAALLLVAAGGFAYAETRGSGRHVTIAGNAVAVIDPNSNRVVDGIPVGARPDAIASGSGSVWVGNLDDETVSRIDPRSDRQVRAISVGFVPSSLAAGSGSVWVAGSNARAPVLLVARLDPQFDVVSRMTRLQNAAADGSGLVAVDSTAVWAAPSYGLLTRLDPGSGQPQRRIDPSTSPTGMALGEGAVWLTESDGDILTRVDRTGLVTTTAVGHGPSGVAVGAGAVWVTDTLDDTLLQIDPSTRVVTRLIRVGKGPLGVAVGAGAVWVANSRDGTVSRVDPETGRVQRIAVGGSPRQLVVADGKVWVTVQAQTIVPEIASGGTVRLTSQQDVDSTDPALAFTPLAWQLLYATCAKLVNYPDETAPRGSQLVPEVASSLPKRSSDGKTYVFTIRPGFRFSPPSNQPVTAQTFRYTIERSLSPTLNGQAQGFLQDVVGAADYMAGRATHVSGIIVRGDTLTIHLRAPAADLPARLALPFFCAVPLGTPADPRGLRAIPSAGPYFVASYTPGEGAVLDRNPNYHGNRPHRLRQITLTVGTSLSQGTREVEAGTADYEAGGVPPSDDQRLLRRYGPSSPAALAAHQQLFVNPQLELDYLALNVARPLFAGTALRRAVNYTVDRQALAEVGSFSSGLPARPTSQYLPPGLPGFRESQPYPLRPNLARARSLASDRHRRAVMYTCDTSPCPELAALLRTELQAIGIDVEVKTMTVSELFARISKKGEPFDIALVAYKADYADPSDFLNLLLDGRKIGTPNNLDFAYFADPGWIRKLHAAAQLSGPARYLTYSRLANEIARDAAPWVPIDNSTVHDFFSRRIGCQVYQPLYGMDIAALCIKSRK